MFDYQIKDMPVTSRQKFLLDFIETRPNKIGLWQIIYAETWKMRTDENRISSIPEEVCNTRNQFYLSEKQILETLPDGIYGYATKNKEHKIEVRWFEVKEHKII